MNNVTTISKFDLNLFRMRFMFTLSGIYFLIIGFYLNILYFYSNNYFSFIIYTLLAFLSALIIACCFYILKHFPDQSNHVPWKIFLFSITGVDILVFILGLLNNLFSSIIQSLYLLVPLIPFIGGFFFITLIFPKKMIFFNPENNLLAYICDYRTQIKEESIILSDVNSIEIKSKRFASLSGRSGKIIFHLKKPVNANETNNILNRMTKEWNITPLYLNYHFYKVIDILSKYPLLLIVDAKFSFRPLISPMKKIILPTQIDFSENLQNYFSKLLQNISQNSLNNISDNKPISSSLDKNSSTKNQLVMSSTQEIIGQYLFTSNKFFVGSVVVLSLLYIYALFVWTNIINIVFIHQNLLGRFFDSKASPFYSWYFNKLYLNNLYYYSVYFFFGLIGFIVTFIIIFWLGLVSIFGREYFVFKDDMIMFSVKVFNKKVFTRKIPKRSIIAIEHSNKGLVLQLLGGDSFVLKVNNSIEDFSKLSFLKDFLLSNT